LCGLQTRQKEHGHAAAGAREVRRAAQVFHVQPPLAADSCAFRGRERHRLSARAGSQQRALRRFSAYLKLNSSTSKMSVLLGGMTGG
jgi:hypothetical protein